MNYTFKSFYNSYLPESEIKAVCDAFDPQEEKLCLSYLQSICNYVVWQTLCQSLSTEDATTFFGKQKQEYNDESLLLWLKERIPDVEMILTEVLERAIKAIHKQLTETS